ncbi:glycosyltransferase family 4 protein [Paenibacillus sp. MWE-103]|uniref:Glycosyltransferase family 4 protein n=1 Tax=Paenibacillus artemisiicola TaxID=1172618 RepID=A0ABS3W902_9BACL|nr:glycosyltransferase family 4 protein [Paenibacillus artemisiicola]MBO7744779.1 glycosyltransferase family 4 protein [Paenibacillus artemisiicola]
MKLLFTYFIPSGGIETLNRLRYHALGAAGIEVHALYLWNGAGTQNMAGIPHFVTNNDFEILEVLRNGYDAVVVICDHLMLQRLRGLGYGGPLIYEAQGLGTKEQAEGTLAFASAFIRMYAQGVISPPTSHLMDIFQRYLGDFPRFYVQNMIDTGQFSHRPSPWLNPDGDPIVGWIGRLEANKNWPLCLRIAARLAAEKPNLRLWLFEDATISEPGERERFVALVRELGLEPNLVVRSNIPHSHMPHYLSAIGDSGGLLLSTSYAEGFGYAVAEAMSCRCPVVSTDSDGVRCFIDHDRTGKFFRSGGVDEAVSEARTLMNDRALAERIRDEAQLHVRQHFSLGRYAADIVNVLTALGLRR